MRELMTALFLALVCTPLVLLGSGQSFAQVMQSSNYRIQSDSINFGGGLSTSSNYYLESTAGEIATGESQSSSYALKAGYQQMLVSYIAMSGASTVVLSPSIPGVTGGTSTGTTTVTVTTDNLAGYSMTIRASNSPAMQLGANTIADYTPGGDPDFTFTTGATDSHFGFTPEGVDIIDRFKDDGGSCNTGALDTVRACWDGLSTSDATVVTRTSPNHPDGSTTTLRFQVGIGNSVVQLEGVYTATTTLTATVL